MTSAAIADTATSRRIVDDMYAAAGRMDFPAMLSYVAGDLVLREPAFLPYGDVYRGRDGMAAAIEKISKYLDVTKIEVRYLVADGDRVFGVVSVPDSRSGQNVLLAEESVIRNGKVAEMTIFFHEARSLAAPIPQTPGTSVHLLL
jgi:ketosteroid isomerase-like protein